MRTRGASAPSAPASARHARRSASALASARASARRARVRRRVHGGLGGGPRRRPPPPPRREAVRRRGEARRHLLEPRRRRAARRRAPTGGGAGGWGSGRRGASRGLLAHLAAVRRVAADRQVEERRVAVGHPRPRHRLRHRRRVDQVARERALVEHPARVPHRRRPALRRARRAAGSRRPRRASAGTRRCAHAADAGATAHCSSFAHESRHVFFIHTGFASHSPSVLQYQQLPSPSSVTVGFSRLRHVVLHCESVDGRRAAAFLSQIRALLRRQRVEQQARARRRAARLHEPGFFSHSPIRRPVLAVLRAEREREQLDDPSTRGAAALFTLPTSFGPTFPSIDVHDHPAARPRRLRRGPLLAGRLLAGAGGARARLQRARRGRDRGGRGARRRRALGSPCEQRARDRGGRARARRRAHATSKLRALCARRASPSAPSASAARRCTRSASSASSRSFPRARRARRRTPAVTRARPCTGLAAARAPRAPLRRPSLCRAPSARQLAALAQAAEVEALRAPRPRGTRPHVWQPVVAPRSAARRVDGRHRRRWGAARVEGARRGRCLEHAALRGCQGSSTLARARALMLKRTAGQR